MKGFIIQFGKIDDSARTQFYKLLFGKVNYKTRLGKPYAHYTPGMLDKTPFYRLMQGKIFVTSIININIEQLKVFGNVIVEDAERDLSFNKMLTGEEYWRGIAAEKNIEFRVRQRKSRRPVWKTEMGSKVTF